MATAAVQQWTGRSDDIAVPLLGAGFWVEGASVEGVLEGKREQKVGGPAYRMTLDTPLSIDGESVTEIEIPSLTGFRNALESLRMQGYQMKKGDMWHVECVGIQKAKKEDFSDSPQFKLAVIRK